MSTLLIKNADAVVTVDAHDRVLKNASILIKDNVIEAVGEGPFTADETIDARGTFVYPGLVNTHHHLYQTFTRNLAQVQNLELFDWLRALYEIWRGLDGDCIYFSSLVGMGELLKYGCTTCMDHHYVFPENSEGFLTRQFEAAEALGIRLFATRGSMSLGRSAGGLPPDDLVQDVDTILNKSRRAVEEFHDPSEFSMRNIGFAPCSPFSVSTDLLKESAKLARSLGVRLHTHLGETRDETDFCMQTLGMRPLAYMADCGFIGSDVWYAHGIHFNDEELKLLAQTQTGVAHCPVSNMKLASGVCRVSDMLKLNIPLGLAVDGSASNDCSNLLAEIRAAYLVHRLTYSANAPAGYDFLKIATRGSARILGRNDIGSLEAGKAADLFMIDMTKVDSAGAMLDPANYLGTVGYYRPAKYVIVNGRVASQDGNLTGIDEGRTAERANALVNELLARA
ncbi:MAG TPA: 8-oxoguanine deaminase [Clostridia bacterium]|nr:8-oxoguanine deaminase [Clostridia bacterium]